MAQHTSLTLPCVLVLSFAFSVALADVVERSFYVEDNMIVNRLCSQQVITAVNGSLPGPTIAVREGDTLVVHVFNLSPYNLTIHWHGIFQYLSGWADGPAYVTQCPILPGNSYTYKFTITGQEGTLWWHAHVSMLRATVYGALVIYPTPGRSYPFTPPDYEFIIHLGEWWNSNVIDVDEQGKLTGVGPNMSDAFTINGQPGDLYPCSSDSTYKMNVVYGKTYLLRIINGALDDQLFFKIANHKMVVVAADAAYTTPYETDVVLLGPGQTTDVLMVADQSPAAYYMAARAYASAKSVPPPPFDNTTATGIITYVGADFSSTTPTMPVLPGFDDKDTAQRFHSSLTGLVNGPFWRPVPGPVDENMFVTAGLGLLPCSNPGNIPCAIPGGLLRLTASMNNESFRLPTTLSILESHFNGVGGIYTDDFPDQPPVTFDYTNQQFSNLSVPANIAISMSRVSTKVKRLSYNSTVQIVLQNTALVGIESHPIHLHGYNFHILAQGFGNYDPVSDSSNFNLYNPQERNTIAVPAGGWAVIRFQANNPGAWIMHCHLDMHLEFGLATVFVVENGPTPETSLPPPPQDLPQC
nr:laccase-7-like [Ipomoea batatas]